MTFKVKTKGQIEGEDLLAPKLRFKEFNNNWNLVVLKSLMDFKNGINAPKDAYGKGIKYISVTDILNNNFITYEKIKGLVDIDSTTLKNNSVTYGDVVFQRSSETIEDIGKSNVYLDANKMATFGGFVIRGKKKGTYDPLFINYLLQNNSSRKSIIVKGAGAQHYNISQEELEKIKVYFTTMAEQEKIGYFFSLLDKKIELQKQKIEALKIYKKGLMQKLINSNNCEEKSVSEFGTIITGATPSKLIDSYWNNGTIVWITPSDITESKDIYNSHDMLTQDGLKAGRFVPAGSILITCIASIGKNAILKIDGSCNQQINAIIPNKNFNADYLYYLFEMKKDYLQSTAGTSATSIINKSSFEKLVFKVPNLEEQNKISKILNCLELKIENEKLKFEKLTFLKKSLLQQMFI